MIKKIITIIIIILLSLPLSIRGKSESAQTNTTDIAIYNSVTPLGTYKITGYVPTCEHCCGKTNGVTKSGEVAEVGVTVAMKGVDFGTRIFIVGIGERVVQDRGCKSGVVDVACESHDACYDITGNYEVYIIN